MRTIATTGLILLVPLLAQTAPLPPEAKAKDTPSLVGTTWEGDGVVAPTTYVFEKDGLLTYSYNGTTYSNGTWKQDGDQLYWECNNRYCEFKGKIDGDTITGRAWNVAGGEWELTFKRAGEEGGLNESSAAANRIRGQSRWQPRQNYATILEAVYLKKPPSQFPSSRRSENG